VHSLPPEAAVWRNGNAWSQQHELAAVAIERAELWSNVLAQVMGAKAKEIPAPITIVHPDRAVPGAARRAPVTDRDQISRFFTGKGVAA
jgi:hypothetical protein